MVLTVFRSRMKPDVQDEYLECVERLSKLARSMPGYVAHKAFVAQDGERVIIAEFASRETHRAWAVHPSHLAAQQQGRRAFYLEYRVQVCTVVEERTYSGA